MSEDEGQRAVTSLLIWQVIIDFFALRVQTGKSLAILFLDKVELRKHDFDCHWHLLIIEPVDFYRKVSICSQKLNWGNFLTAHVNILVSLVEGIINRKYKSSFM
jgi:hypothetical protein